MNDSFHAASSILAEVTHIMDVVASFRDHPEVDHAGVDGGGLGPLDHGQLAAPPPLHGGSRGRGGGGAWQKSSHPCTSIFTTFREGAYTACCHTLRIHLNKQERSVNTPVNEDLFSGLRL